MEAIGIELDIIAFGVIAASVTSIIVYYSYRAVQSFRDDAELASTKLALRDEADEAYRILAGAAMVFSTLTLIGAFGLAIDGFGKLQYLSEVGGIVFMLGMVIFHKKIAKATEKVEKEEEE